MTFPKPMVAAINGHAIAGGCILAAACDHRIMVEGNGRIGIPELAVGVPFPALPLQIMSARLADGALRDLVFTGRTVQIDEAMALGLIDEKCPAGMLLDRAQEVAREARVDSCRRVRADKGSVLSRRSSNARSGSPTSTRASSMRGSAAHLRHDSRLSGEDDTEEVTYSQTQSLIDNPSARRSRWPKSRGAHNRSIYVSRIKWVLSGAAGISMNSGALRLISPSKIRLPSAHTFDFSGRSSPSG